MIELIGDGNHNEVGEVPHCSRFVSPCENGINGTKLSAITRERHNTWRQRPRTTIRPDGSATAPCRRRI